MKIFRMGLLCTALLTASFAVAQQVDAAFGLGTVISTSGSNVSPSSNYFPQDVGGGVFPGLSADFMLRHRFGVGGEIFWRAGQNSYFGYQPFRPIFWNFNGVWAPQIRTRLGAELVAGIGEESIRYYQPYAICSSFTGCTDYTSQGHLMGAFGGGLRVYVTEHVFVRPEARLYLIHDNFQFSSGHATRVGVSVGYSFGGP